MEGQSSEDFAHVRKRLERYAAHDARMTVACEHVPEDMHEGPVGDGGWVTWKLCKSAVREDAIIALEDAFDVCFPPFYRTYLKSYAHLFDQVHSRRYEQQILLPVLPTREPLTPLRVELKSSPELRKLRLLPFATWGDGWGPMCFDLEGMREDGSAPIVWVDHELMHACTRNEDGTLAGATRLYASFREMFDDIFIPYGEAS